MKHVHIIASSPAEEAYIDAKIIEYNSQKVPFTQTEPFIPLNYVIKNDRDEIIGGINAVSYCWKIVYINILWVDEAYRSHGYGMALLQKVEEQAKNIGCTLVHLDTFDFQAYNFYLKQGYVVFGKLDQCPPGHTKYFMSKKL